MSYFKQNKDVIISTEIAFGAAVVGTRNYMTCKNGEVIGWEFNHEDADGNVMIDLFNASAGTDTLVASVFAMRGYDIFRGLFSSGAIPSAKITDTDCVFYRVDYT